MKCPHCNQDHPDGTKFCPQTGKALILLKACINTNCHDYGKRVLPSDSAFCPSCGEPLEMKKEDSIWDNLQNDKNNFLMPVDDVFYLQGHGTVATGQVEYGFAEPGDDVLILGYDVVKQSWIVNIEYSGIINALAYTGDKVSLLLSDIKKEDVKRGMVIAHPNVIGLHRCFKACIYVVKADEGGLGKPIHDRHRTNFFIRTAEVLGEIYLHNSSIPLLPGDNAEIIVNLFCMVPLNTGLRIIIRDEGRVEGILSITELLD